MGTRPHGAHWLHTGIAAYWEGISIVEGKGVIHLHPGARLMDDDARCKNTKHKTQNSKTTMEIPRKEMGYFWGGPPEWTIRGWTSVFGRYLGGIGRYCISKAHSSPDYRCTVKAVPPWVKCDVRVIKFVTRLLYLTCLIGCCCHHCRKSGDDALCNRLVPVINSDHCGLLHVSRSHLTCCRYGRAL